MSELRLETYAMPAASLGPESPLPPLDACLPYTFQDDYNRKREKRNFRVAVLENDILKAVFLLELGGRLWSLFHKKAQRELLYVNPVFQPCNLGIRNAWFSGGVEWNMGTIGHSVFTCSQVFAASLKMDDGTPVLRMYEWDRIRMAPYQIDAFLPGRSEYLFVRTRIINPHEHELPMYWWSNIAVRESPGVRVIAPAESACRHSYKGELAAIDIPVSDGTDISYPENYNHSSDLYYLVGPERRPWITALDREGCGLIQASTARLRGRKLFVWGMQSGGRNWQEFLSVPGSAYIELQAGLAKTQSEYLQMPAGAEWSWLEAYGLMRSSPETTRGKDWQAACRAVEDFLRENLSQDMLESKLKESAGMSGKPPEEIIQRGSGWGALERLRREKAGEPPFCSDSMVFDDESLTERQKPWLELLMTGMMPYANPAEAPGSWMVQKSWKDMLEESVRRNKSNHWLVLLHLGTMYYSLRDFEKAERLWKQSLDSELSPWAYRNLAVLLQKNKRIDEASGLLLKAAGMAPGIYSLAVECCKTLIDAGRYELFCDFINRLPPDIRRRGRIQIMEARAVIKRDNPERAEEILRSRPVVADVREGELTLSDLWFEMHEKLISRKENIPVDENLRKRVMKEFPVPAWMDFRQSA